MLGRDFLNVTINDGKNVESCKWFRLRKGNLTEGVIKYTGGFIISKLA